MGQITVAEIGDIAPGEMTSVRADGLSTLLANVDVAYYAVHDIRTHRGCTLPKGSLNGKTIACPYHGSRFDVTTGEVVRGPARKSETSYRVTVEGNAILIEKKS